MLLQVSRHITYSCRCLRNLLSQEVALLSQRHVVRRWRLNQHVLAVLEVSTRSRLILGNVTTRMLTMPEDLLSDRLVQRELFVFHYFFITMR